MLPRDLPPDQTMTSLGWLIHGTDVADHEDTLLVTLPGGGAWCVMPHEIDHLTDKGWIDMGVDEHVTVTARGTYWYDRWWGKRPDRDALPGSDKLKGDDPRFLALLTELSQRNGK